MKLARLFVLVPLTFAAGQQDVVGDFTTSPNEHIINEIGHPFTVRSVQGVVTERDETVRLASVLFEIQGPAGDRKIRKAITDQNGHFRIRDVPSGTYRFKATLMSNQSVMGTIIVTPKIKTSGEIRLTMHVGV